MVVLPVLAGGLVIAMWPKPKVSPEDEVRAWVAKLVVAAERRDVGSISDALTDSFKTRGGWSRAETKQYLAALLMRSSQGVTVINPSLDVTIESPTSGTLRGTFVFAQGQGGADIGRYDLTARFTKRDDHWEFTTAEWK
jgi:hypothetical protein